MCFYVHADSVVHTHTYTHMRTYTHTDACRQTDICVSLQKKKRVNGRTGIQLMDMMSKLTCMLEGDISVIGEREIWG